MNLKILLLTIINVSFTGLCYTQTIENALGLGKNLYSEKKFDEAIDIYRRIIYFAKEKKDITEAYFYLAGSYLHLHDYDNASAYFDSVKTITDIKENTTLPSPVFRRGAGGEVNDSINTEASFNIVACRILQNDNHYALITLLDIKDSLSQYFDNKKLFYLAVIHFKIGQFDLSEHYFTKLVESGDSVKKTQIDQIFNEIDKINRIKPGLAKFLSRVIPGAGQIYYGDIKNGLNSFVINGSLIAAGVYLANAYTIFDAFMFTGNWFLRYYKGGYLKAKSGAENKIETFRNKKLRELINLIAI